MRWTADELASLEAAASVEEWAAEHGRSLRACEERLRPRPPRGPARQHIGDEWLPLMRLHSDRAVALALQAAGVRVSRQAVRRRRVRAGIPPAGGPGWRQPPRPMTAADVEEWT